ncbi:sensor histidine kinase [Paenibacillus radicis (ex Xue et al. 2023)]|uniref:histidine kinase n=1 Tax=Paenibacillus radicis (ex Xue et al. 2023) TaxID=2972489 RepID=A0ABT1YKW3_9BACL|nr:sensor histidine kinase [Paenibacillus radicis (ex Xue et al. 2023)]MCR8633827.1 sensor histidine kinase [Paenibacillus radicis (ex Xue et al. 2023)]
MQAWKRAADWFQRYILLRNLPLTSKMFFYSALIVVFPMLLVGLISYERSSEVLEREAGQYSWQIIEQVKTHVEYYVRDFEINTLRIINHPDMVQFLRMRTLEEVQQSGIRDEIEQVLKNATYSRSDISNITVILNDVQVVDATEFNSPTPAEELEKEYWYPNIPLDGSPRLISRVIQWPDRQEQVISIVRRLISPHTLDPIGVMIMDVNFKRIQEITEKVSIGRTGFLYILDAQNHYVYHPDMQQVGKRASDINIGYMLQNDSGSMITMEEPSNFLTYSLSPYLGWRLVTSIPYKELTNGANYIGHTIFWTLLVTLIVAYLLGIGFATSLLQPIRKLHHFMKKVEVGDFSGKLEVRSKDELGLLTHGFNKMVEKLEGLLEEIYFTRLRETEASLRQKETELKVLQSQMNPHFLYNSLETLRGMALDQDMDDIAEMSASLAKLLRYNLKNDSPTVSLREELRFCEVYLRIQKFRFEERLEYELDVPEWALDQNIVKFSLQPIVENSMIHGIEPGIGLMQIRITAVRDTEGTFFVAVRDTGVGMSEEQLRHIHQDLEGKDVLAGGDHIGIVNVHRRISYLYGKEYGVTLNSIPGKGTAVRIRIPFLEESGKAVPITLDGSSRALF